MDARRFLKNNGLSELTKIVVEDNKFESLQDLSMLADNQRFLEVLKIPVCWQLKFVNAISKLTQSNDYLTPKKLPVSPALSVASTSSEEKSACESPLLKGEISKKRLLALAKTDMTAQAVNLKYNDLNKFLLAELRRAETQWQGARGLKKCDSTDEEDARNNMSIADQIVDNPNVSRFYGTYDIGEHGTFIISRAKAKLLFGRKLSQQRKPSAYKRKLSLATVKHDDGQPRVNKRTNLTANTEIGKGKESTVEKRNNKKSVGNKSENTVEKTVEEILAGINEPGNESDKENLSESEESEVSDYEKKRLACIEENNLAMLNNYDILPQSMGVLAALFYLNVKKITDVSMTKLRKEVAVLGMRFPKETLPTKQHLTYLLGKELLTKGKLKRKDLKKPISRDNLIVA